MTTLQLPREIHASVHQDAVSRVPDFFNAGLSDILTELFQNSRRAGATAIHASTHDGLLTIADDGAGIADPAVLLAFGDSQWDNPLTKSENPAGMGLYSLARREEVTIRSWPANGQPWQVQLQPGNFTGHQPARVTPLSDENKQGTAITFPYERDPQEAMKKASRYFPLPVNFKGEILPSSPFTQGAAHTEEWNGILIAVYPKTRRCPRLNFHGLVINCDHLSYIADLHDYWLADAEVIDCPELRLTLPSRKELVITPFLSRLKEASAAAIYRAMLKHPTPVDVSHPVQQHALSLGITLPDARPLLRPWQPEHADPNAYEPTREHTEIPTDALIMDCTPPVPDQAALARAAAEKALQDRLMTANADLTGYRWYDQLTKVQAISIVADQNGEENSDNLSDPKRTGPPARSRTETRANHPHPRVRNGPRTRKRVLRNRPGVRAGRTQRIHRLTDHHPHGSLNHLPAGTGRRAGKGFLRALRRHRRRFIRHAVNGLPHRRPAHRPRHPPNPRRGDNERSGNGRPRTRRL